MAGTLVSLSLVGLVFMFYMCTGNTAAMIPNSSCNICNDCCYCCYSPFSSPYYGPIWLGPNDAACAQCCCNCNCCEGGACSGVGAGADCCAGATMGEECLVFALVICIVLAVVGVIVSCFAGVIYVNRILQKHIHVVSKKTWYDCSLNNNC